MAKPTIADVDLLFLGVDPDTGESLWIGRFELDGRGVALVQAVSAEDTDARATATAALRAREAAIRRRYTG